jgi:competence protein ComEC
MSSGAQRPPAPLFNAACCAVVGIFLADQAGSWLELGLGLGAAAATYALCAPGRLPWLAVLLLGAGTLHHWRREYSPSRKLARHLHPSEPRVAVVTGTVVGTPKATLEAAAALRSHFLFQIESADVAELSIVGAAVLVHSKGEGPQNGERLRLRAGLRRIPPARNPGQPDWAALSQRQGLWAEAFVSSPGDILVLSGPPAWQPAQWAARCRAWISDALSRGIENQPLEHSLITSMVLGVKNPGLREVEVWFRDTGTLHLFAVSGLNLTMLAWLLSTILQLTVANHGISAAVALPFLMFYAAVTGLGPSCVRAFVATVLFLGSTWADRPAVAYNSLAAAALAQLLADTDNLFSGGFQLSFFLVLALLWISGPLGRRLCVVFQPDPLLPRKIWSFRQRCWVRLGGSLSAAAAASVVAFVAGLPWGMLVFHSVSPIGVVVNLLVIPLAFGILSLGLAGVACAPAATLVACINQLNALLASVLLDVVRIGSGVPGGHWAAANPFLKKPDFTVLDVGNGGAVVLDIAGKPWLLDCGSEPQFETLLLPALRHYGVDRLEGLVLSHGDVGHIGGALQTQRLFQPRRIVDSALKDRSTTRKRVAATLLASGTPPNPAAAGDWLQTNPDASLEVLYPPRGHTASLADDKCLVVRFHTPQWSLLYTADSGYPTERWLLEHCPEKLRSDVWVRGRHVREITGTDEFVEAVNPALIVVSGAPGGRGPGTVRYWAERWRARGREVWLQQDTGAVEGWVGRERRIRGILNRQAVEW